jgi:EmrB/QacA subfamily drug resistance transporter
VCLALTAVIASVSGLNVAQPQLARAFDASQGDVLWMINLYTLTMAALLLPLGAAGDRWDRKPVLVAGLVVFGVASAAAGLASTTPVMLAARFFSGVGAAMIMPVTLAVLTSTFPPAECSRAIGAWTAVAGGAGVLGMFVSAVLVDLGRWRWIFVLPVVLVLAAIPMALEAIPDSRGGSGRPFDFIGALTSLVAVVGLVLFLNLGPGHGWTTTATLLSLLAGLGSATAFVAWELRREAPLLDVRLFRQRGLASGSVSLLAVFGVPTGIFVVLYPYLQAVLGWSGLASTLALMPMPVLMIACSALAPRLAARIGVGPTMAAGLFLGGAGLALMAILVSVDGGYLSVLPGYLVMGLGMGLAMTPATEAITSSLPRERQGVASALNDVAREFGSALGVALLGAVFATGYRDGISLRLEGVPAGAADGARKGIAGALAVTREAHPYAKALFRSAQESFVQGWQRAMWAGVIAMAVVLVYVLVRGPGRPGSLGVLAGEPHAGQDADRRDTGEEDPQRRLAPRDPAGAEQHPADGQVEQGPEDVHRGRGQAFAGRVGERSGEPVPGNAVHEVRHGIGA